MSQPANLPEISVIMPTYNRRNFIDEAIKSVLQQTYKNFELIIVDDGSTDGTQELVQLYIKDCHYYLLPHGGNISRLRNFGLQKARGKYVAYLDSDDVWEKEKLEEQMKVLQAYPTVGLVFTDVTEFQNDLIIKERLYKNVYRDQEISFKELLTGKLPVYPSSILYRKDCLAQASLHDESFLWNDLGFITRLTAYHRAIMIPKTLTRIRKHASNISTVLKQEAVGYRDMIKTIEQLYHEKFLTNEEYAGMSARFYYSMATMLSQLKEFEKAAGAYHKALKFDRFFLKAWIRLFINRLRILFSNRR